MGGTVSMGHDNDHLIDNLLRADYIRSPSVERVFRAVDRADYFLPDARGNAYKDLAWKCGHLHLSAPCIYSEVIEGLSLTPGLSFLNLGSGTGYLSTMVGLILGSNGINHGIEIHEDVVQYANKKLEDFKRFSGAVDEFDFCEPKFVQGNCLCLTTERQYDRVYCGAACPEPYESYMKNFLRVGGILVMPLNEYLVQIKRTTEITWDVRYLLPVSFATLIQPTDLKQDVVEMVDVVPLSLQSLSRAVIRSILRRNIELENPNLKKRAPPSAKQPKSRERALRRFVVPIFDDSGDEVVSSDGEDRNIFDIVMDHLAHRVRGRQGSLRRNEQRNRTNQSNTEEEMEVETDNNSVNNSNENEPPSSPVVKSEKVQAVIENEQPNITAVENVKTEEEALSKEEEEEESNAELEEGVFLDSIGNDEEEKSDQNIVADDEIQELELDSASSNSEETESNIISEESNIISEEKSDDVSKEAMTNLEAGSSLQKEPPAKGLSKRGGREKFDSGFGEEIIEKNATGSDSSDHEHMDFESSSSSNDENDGKRNKRGSKYNAEIHGGAKWRRICLSAHRYDSLSSSSDSETVQEEVNVSTNESRTVISPYTVHMRNKIQELPLPPILKNYLNFYREF